MSQNIPIITLSSDFIEHAKKIADKYNLIFCKQLPIQPQLYLYLDHNGLSLVKTARKSALSVRVDFTSGKMNFRRQHGGGRQQAIAKAIGITQKYFPSILDATAGLGNDAFVLASLGCDVTLLERSPIIAALLEDGLNRAKNHLNIQSIISRMHLITTDSFDYIQKIKPHQKPDIIYLDPMFPPRKKSALVKKEMQLLQELLKDNLDVSNQLLEIALKKIKTRVVVKRFKLSPYLNNLKPDHSLVGKNSRFDVYLGSVRK